MDEYIIEDNNYVIRFFRNGLLHREAGPAIFYKKYESQHLNLGDEHLYVIKKVETTQEEKEKWGSPYDHKYKESMAIYMIYGKPFIKENFDLEIKKIQAERMQEQLNKELLTNKDKIKKTKI